MTNIRLKTTILKGNNEILKELAGKQGLSIEDFFYMLGNCDWFCITNDVLSQWRIEGRRIPEELEFLDKENPDIQIVGKNTEPLKSCYVSPETERKLLTKVHIYALKSLGLLIDKICHWPLRFINPDLINGTKSKGGK